MPSQMLLYSPSASFFLGSDLKTTLFLLDALIKKSNLTHSSLPQQHFITLWELRTIVVGKHCSVLLSPWLLLGGLAHHSPNSAPIDYAADDYTDLKIL